VILFGAKAMAIAGNL